MRYTRLSMHRYIVFVLSLNLDRRGYLASISSISSEKDFQSEIVFVHRCVKVTSTEIHLSCYESATRSSPGLVFR